MSSVFRWPVRVFYEDTDTAGIVYYANYLKFFERARTEWLRAAGIQQSELSQAAQRAFVVSRCVIDYHAPARLDDQLEFTVVVENLGRASVSFHQQAWLKNAEGQPRLLCNCHVRVGCVDTVSLRPAPLPAHVREQIRLHV
ncbi:MAG: tol-pal system-associated acyl-CoA thioesterase [Pseudomonadota bacterium]|jgi:acyl-CoA thioester hydrolase